MSESKTKRNIEVVVFENRKRQKRLSMASETQVESERNENRKNIFDMKRARFEVFKFGIRGFENSEKRKAEENLLIDLGAKPRKAKCINYKELMVQKKEEKRRLIEERERNQKGNVKIIGPKKKTKQKKRNVNEVRGFDAQIGKYKNGVQIVNKKLLNKSHQ